MIQNAPRFQGIYLHNVAVIKWHLVHGKVVFGG